MNFRVPGILFPVPLPFSFSITNREGFYCVFLVSPLAAGLLYSQSAQNASQPVTVAAMPAIQGQAPLMTKLRGHSSWAKWRTETVFFSSTLL